MLNMDKIHEEIKCLEECGNTSYDVCKKLAILYIVKDHYEKKTNERETVMSTSPISKSI